MMDKRLTILILLLFLVLGFTNSSQLVKGQINYAPKFIVEITSPLQDDVYNNNNVLLNFTFSTNMTDLSAIDGVAFAYNLDGQLGYHDGNGTRIGWFTPPFSPSYSTMMDVPDGNHLLWVVAILYFKGSTGLTVAEYLSQIVNFSVSTETPTSSISPSPSPTLSPSPSPTVPEFPSWLILPFLIAATVLGAILIIRSQVERRRNC